MNRVVSQLVLFIVGCAIISALPTISSGPSFDRIVPESVLPVVQPRSSSAPQMPAVAKTTKENKAPENWRKIKQVAKKVAAKKKASEKKNEAPARLAPARLATLKNSPCGVTPPHMAKRSNNYKITGCEGDGDYHSGLAADRRLLPGQIKEYGTEHPLVLFIGQGTAGIEQENAEGGFPKLEEELTHVMEGFDKLYGKGNWAALFAGDPPSDGGVGNVMTFVKNTGHLTLAYQNTGYGLFNVARQNADYVEYVQTYYSDNKCKQILWGGYNIEAQYTKGPGEEPCTLVENVQGHTRAVGNSQFYLDPTLNVKAVVRVGLGGPITAQELEGIKAVHPGIQVTAIIKGVCCAWFKNEALASNEPRWNENCLKAQQAPYNCPAVLPKAEKLSVERQSPPPFAIPL